MPDSQINLNEAVGGVSGQELRWSQWWVDHRERVGRIATGLFIVADAVLLGVGIWGFTDWLAFGGLKEEQAIRQMTGAGYGQFPDLGLQEVRLDAPIVLPAGSGKVDVLVPVANPNPRFWAELRYRLVIGGTERPLRTAFILPGQTKYLAELAAPTDTGASAEVKVERRVWHRATPSGGLDQQAFADARLDIRAENAVYRPAVSGATSVSSSAAFTLVNDTVFSYYDVGVLVLLYNGDAIVGVNENRLDTLPARSRRPMEIFWYQPLPSVSKVEVVPDINIYDPDAYRKLGT